MVYKVDGMTEVKRIVCDYYSICSKCYKRHHVKLACALAANLYRGGAKSKKYCYTYVDIAKLGGVTVEHLRNIVSQGRLRLGDLRDVVRFLRDRIE